jgi:hypothetical protein
MGGDYDLWAQRGESVESSRHMSFGGSVKCCLGLIDDQSGCHPFQVKCSTDRNTRPAGFRT